MNVLFPASPVITVQEPPRPHAVGRLHSRGALHRFGARGRAATSRLLTPEPARR